MAGVVICYGFVQRLLPFDFTCLQLLCQELRDMHRLKGEVAPICPGPVDLGCPETTCTGKQHLFRPPGLESLNVMESRLPGDIIDVLLAGADESGTATPLILAQEHEWDAEFVKHPCSTHRKHLLVIACSAAHKIGNVRLLCHLDIRRQPGQPVLLLLEIGVVLVADELGEKALLAIGANTPLHHVSPDRLPELYGVNTGTAHRATHPTGGTVIEVLHELFQLFLRYFNGAEEPGPPAIALVNPVPELEDFISRLDYIFVIPGCIGGTIFHTLATPGAGVKLH